MSIKPRAGTFRRLLVLVFTGCVSAGVVADDPPENAFKSAGFDASFRWRLEHVKQAPLSKKALAIPLRARLNWNSSEWKGWSLFAEYDYIADFGVDTYNEGGGNTPDRAPYPVVADPSGGDFNQGYLQWKSAAGDRVRAGRQRIIYDNARFIGNVGWRQNEQTYDSVSFERTGLAGFDLRAAYLDEVHRIFGNDVAAGSQDLDTWLVNASYSPGGDHRLTGYFYDIDNEDSAALSNRTIGLRFAGKLPAGQANLDYGLEYANQNDAGNSPVDFSANYWRADLAAQFEKLKVYGGFESLGGDQANPGRAFRTPLATLHAFNGWADKFLATPDAGLDDWFVGLKGPLSGWSWDVVYHDFSAESGNQSFGSEWDASISTRFNEHMHLLLKAAKFETDSPAYGDTTKFWVQVSVDL